MSNEHSSCIDISYLEKSLFIVYEAGVQADKDYLFRVGFDNKPVVSKEERSHNDE